MAFYPAFQKTGLSTLIFSKGQLFPIRRTEHYDQVVQQSEAGLVRIATLRPPVTFSLLHFEQLPLVDYLALRAWVRHPLIDGQAFPFAYRDATGTFYAVRWWRDTLEMPEVHAGLYAVDITLRHESLSWLASGFTLPVFDRVLVGDSAAVTLLAGPTLAPSISEGVSVGESKTVSKGISIGIIETVSTGDTVVLLTVVFIRTEELLLSAGEEITVTLV